MLSRSSVPARSKNPAAYHPPLPSETTSAMLALVGPGRIATSGNATSAMPVERESLASGPVRGPTRSNVPPR